MSVDLKKLETQLLKTPFDQELRVEYATTLEDLEMHSEALSQWQILAQNDIHNSLYQDAVNRLSKSTTEFDEQSPATNHQAFQLVSGGGEPAEHNVINLSRPDKIRFADIAGMAETKKALRRRIIDPFINPSLFHRFKRKAGGGVLLYGPPGCGKTMMAKAIATECKATFFNIGISDILNMYIGQSEENLANIFAQARNSTPAVLFFDELDALAFSRSKARSDHTRTLVNEFLTQLDGVGGDNDKLLILGATNMPWDVDDAMKRPGRFDRQIFIPPPDTSAIAEMFETKLREVPCQKIDFVKIANLCDKLSGADIDGLIELAKDRVLDDILDNNQDRQLSENDLIAVIDDVTPSALEWLQTARNLIKYANASGSYKDVAKYLKSAGIY